MAPSLAPLACATLAALVYFNTLDAGFVYDDNRAILANDDVRWSSPLWSIFLHDFWGTPLQLPGSHKSWRPLTVLTFRLNHFMSGLRPRGFHVTNVVLHALVTGLFLMWARGVVPRGPAPLIAALVFAVHPVHCEAVAGVVGRAELACTAAMLLAMLVYRTHARVRDDGSRGATTLLALTVLLATLATLFKEQGLVTLALCAICDVISCARPMDLLRCDVIPKLKAMRSSIYTLVSVSVVLLAVRLAMMGGNLPKFASADNPAAHSKSFITRTLTFLYLPVFNFGLFLCPTTLSFDWSMDAVPLIEHWSDVRNSLSTVFYVGLASVLWRECRSVLRGKRRGRGTLLAVAITVVTFLPASNIAGYVGFVAAERVLYAPSLGLSLLLGLGISKMWKLSTTSGRRVLLMALLLLLVCLSARTWRRNQDWNSEEALYRSGIGVNPAKAYGNLGSVLSTTGRVHEAEECYRRALKHRPNMADVHYNLGLLLLQTEGRLDEAIESFHAAIACRPRLAAAHVSLGVALGRLGKEPEALSVLQRAAKMDGAGLRDPRAHEAARASALFHLGRLQLERGRPAEALAAFLRAKETMPSNFQPQSVYNLLGEAYSRLGRLNEAESWVRASLASRPDHVPAHLTYAKLLATNKSRIDEAESWYHRAMQLAPSDPTVLRHYGEFLVQQGRHSRAAHVLERVLNETGSSRRYQDLLNAATALRLAGKLSRAVELYTGARDLRPQEAASHANLGAALHLAGRLHEAETCYLQALRLKPNDSVTHMNLVRLRKLMSPKRET